MASARRLTFVGAAMLVLTIACVTWAGWTIYKAVRGPPPVQVGPDFQTLPNSTLGRHPRSRQQKYSTPEAKPRDVPEGR